MLVDWLLESSIPSIRYFTLRELLGTSDDDAQVQAVRENMNSDGPIPKIIEKQTSDGSWDGEHSYYTPKYTSTHWSMLLLAELGANPTLPALQSGVEFMLSATSENVQAGGHGLECLWGNILYYALYCGKFEDERVQQIIDYLVTHAEWRCSSNAELSCAWGASRALWGLSAIPENQRSPVVQATIENGINFLLEQYSLTDADYPTPGEPHKLWSKTSFPLFYQSDILFVLRVMAQLNQLQHPRLQVALKWLADRRNATGQWRGASPYRQQTWLSIGDRDETKRWVSLQSAVILKQANMLTER